jgi:hypothetical protein
MLEHKAIMEYIVALDCMYGECDHGDWADCRPFQMLVCDTHREPWEGGCDHELFLPWPCDEETPASPATQEAPHE